MKRPRWVMLALALLLALPALLPAGAVAARQRMSFTPGDRSRVAAPHQRTGRPTRRGATRHHGGRPSHATRGRGRGDADQEGAAEAAPGGGFKLENGVLTYPAPSRFQPGNLHRR